MERHDQLRDEARRKLRPAAHARPRPSKHADVLMTTASRLRDRAARCRDMAASTRWAAMARELHSIAADYDGDASRLERRMAAR